MAISAPHLDEVWITEFGLRSLERYVFLATDNPDKDLEQMLPLSMQL
jgi:hypothetical protein